MLELANALEGMSFTDAAAWVGMERQALGDAAQRDNAEGLNGLYDREKLGRPRKLDATQEKELGEIILEGPIPIDGIPAVHARRPLRDQLEALQAALSPERDDQVIKRLGFPAESASTSPEKDEAARAAFKGAAERLKTVGDTHPGKKFRLFFQDEARVGQKGRVCHRWYTKGKRPPGAPINATRSPTSSAPSSRERTTPSRSSCRRCRPTLCRSIRQVRRNDRA